MSQPWSTAQDAELKKIRGVCLDIDDTLSTHGKLTAEAFASLWALKNAGFAVVPVTGRPAGWCDHFARFWPVDAVVGENGGFTFYMEGGKLKRLNTLPGAQGAKARIDGLKAKVLERFPHAKWATDQGYREYDLAIDFCEDVPRWPETDVDALVELCAREGAHAKISSIHVNAWFGDYDKVLGFRTWLEAGAPGSGQKPAESEWLFIGDSPNDEPMFRHFKASVGVANLANFLDRLKFPPRWITASESGQGFSEMVSRLVSLR